ncbi:uncharacterized protein GGS25DRAFT_509741 [Hypoxylon fragiforme]|uniref:uncharacterized protein n=1 Tax=Hypoxylon fragiforme TaxID=63214 RepID=UPI0020C5BDF1|nr:uncharacterized protein GGS25DRAFT_509741 [Hypoxylon fragiforme]KAI2603048.1 hypothetical protein GGS25DRAFT_509741 [Hypoxylon fragiforme]
METDVDEAEVPSKVLQNALAEVVLPSERQSGNTANQNEICCVICLDRVTEACEARPCGHRNFDYVCLINWLEQQAKCPLCKSNVNEVWYDFNHNGADAKNQVYLVPPPKEPSQNVLPNILPNLSQQQSQHPPWHHAQLRLRHQQTRFALQRYLRSRSRYPPTAPRQLTSEEALLRRKQVYRHQLYSLHVGSNHISGFRDLTPQLFQTDPEMVSRARSWLRRELQVFEFLHTPPTAQSNDDAMTRRRATNAEFLLEYIIAILKAVDIQGSQGQAEEMLKDFLGRANTKLLLHELANFLRSPWSIEDWDRKVQYPIVRMHPVVQDEQEEEGGFPTGHRQVERESSDTGTLTGTLMGTHTGTQRTGDFYRPNYSDQNHRRTKSTNENQTD